MRRYHDYYCDTCNSNFESLREDGERDSVECKRCGGTAKRTILKAPELDPRMGVDPDFPTAAKKWEDNRRKRATGQMKDSNNTRYGTERDIERDAYDLAHGYY